MGFGYVEVAGSVQTDSERLISQRSELDRHRTMRNFAATKATQSADDFRKTCDQALSPDASEAADRWNDQNAPAKARLTTSTSVENRTQFASGCDEES